MTNSNAPSSTKNGVNRKAMANMMRFVSNLTALVLTAGCKPDAASVATASVWLTTGDSAIRLEKVAELPFQSNMATADYVIDIEENRTYQAIKGFGAAMTGSAAYVLTRHLGDTRRQEVMRSLFSREDGIGLSYVRMTIGASDFSSHHYSYNDPPASTFDEKLQYFSIEEDQDDVIPRLKEALAINSDLEIMGSPWSAPAFLKTTGSMIGGKLKPGAEPIFANYLLKYVQAFARVGAPISAITIQNEPQHEPSSYPGMLMTAVEQRDFIKNHLGPLFRRQSITTEIVAYDHNWDHIRYPLTVLNDPAAKQYVVGSAFHCYGGDVGNMSKVHEAHPDRAIFFTECSGGAWSTDWRNNLIWNFRNIIIGNLRNWATCVLLWNLALDEDSGPQSGGCQNCRGVLTVHRNGRVERNIEYYVLGHASKFVYKGAKRIFSTDLSDKGLANVAFINPDGSKTLIVLNEYSTERALQIRAKEGALVWKIPAYSAATLHWK